MRNVCEREHFRIKFRVTMHFTVYLTTKISQTGFLVGNRSSGDWSLRFCGNWLTVTVTVTVIRGSKWNATLTQWKNLKAFRRMIGLLYDEMKEYRNEVAVSTFYRKFERYDSLLWSREFTSIYFHWCLVIIAFIVIFRLIFFLE